MQAAQHAQMLQEEAIKQVDLRRRMRATVVPVIDADVRDTLRQLGEPVTLFGEQEVRLHSAMQITSCVCTDCKGPEQCQSSAVAIRPQEM